MLGFAFSAVKVATDNEPKNPTNPVGPMALALLGITRVGG
jgi:hypothetical protein